MTAPRAKFDTAGTVICRQSVGFEPKFGWYRGSHAPRPDLLGRAFFIALFSHTAPKIRTDRKEVYKK